MCWCSPVIALSLIRRRLRLPPLYHTHLTNNRATMKLCALPDSVKTVPTEIFPADPATKKKKRRSLSCISTLSQVPGLVSKTTHPTPLNDTHESANHHIQVVPIRIGTNPVIESENHNREQTHILCLSEEGLAAAVAAVACAEAVCLDTSLLLSDQMGYSIGLWLAPGGFSERNLFRHFVLVKGIRSGKAWVGTCMRTGACSIGPR